MTAGRIDVGAHREQMVRAARRRPDAGFDCGFARLRARVQVRIGPDMQEARDFAGDRIHRGEDRRELHARRRLLLPGRDGRRQAGRLQQIGAHLEDRPVLAGLDRRQERKLARTCRSTAAHDQLDDSRTGSCSARTPSRSAARSASLRVVMQQQDLVEVADLAVQAGEELALARIGLQPLLDAAAAPSCAVRLHRDDRDVIRHWRFPPGVVARAHFNASLFHRHQARLALTAPARAFLRWSDI